VSSGAGERTEKATPKKRRDAREKGNVFKSADVNAAVTLLILFGVFKISGSHMVDRLKEAMTKYLRFGSNSDFSFNIKNVSLIFLDAILFIVKTGLPIFVVAVLAGVIINYIQIGFLFTTKPLEMKLDKLNPLAGFKRIFSVRSLFELLKSSIKIFAIGYLAYKEIKDNFEGLPRLIEYDYETSWSIIMDIAMSLAFKSGIVLGILAVFDYLYQWWQYERDLKMTKQEVKEEYKLLEGDPTIKGKIRSKQRQMGMARMMKSVPTADVVITNPTHYAVAIKYDDKVDKAPVVVAKGKDYLALKIKEVAKEHNVEMVENRPLAQSLYIYCEVGHQIPPDLYQAVAEVLAYVYRLKHKIKR